MVRIFLVLLGFLLIPELALTNSDFHVILDPGHGGQDSGASRGSIKESEIALAVSKKVRARLKPEKQVRVTLTREEDEFLNLKQRSDLARRLRADLFISIHANSNLDPRVRGAEFYFKNQLPPEEESLFLANRENQVESETVLEIDQKKRNVGLAAIKEDLQTTYHLYLSRELGRSLKTKWKEDHGIRSVRVRQGPFHVISQVPMPALLVELGFISNPQESRWLADQEVQRALAESIANGILGIKEKMDKGGESRHIAAHAN